MSFHPVEHDVQPPTDLKSDASDLVSSDTLDQLYLWFLT